MSEISFSFTCRILNYINNRGIDSDALLQKAGVDPSHLTHSRNKISIESYFAILEEAVRQTEDPFFGLHMGEFFEWRDLSNLGYLMNLGYIMASCQNLGHAIEKASEYLGFIDGPFDSEMIVSGEQTEILFSPLYPEQQYITHCIDEALSSFIKIVRNITDEFIKLKEMRVPYKTPDHMDEYKRIFSCPVFFTQSTAALVFNSRDLLSPIITGKIPRTVPLMPSERTLYNRLDYLHEYSKKTSLLLYDYLQKKGAPCIKQVAKDLGMSVRCLQMKLSREGETFSRIVKNVRKEMAKTYLTEQDYSIDEITSRLGFSDPSVFHRAFKNWTGLTPGQYRNTPQ